RLDLGDFLREARRDRERAGAVQAFGDRRTREGHELVLRFQLLRLAIRAVAEHEAVVRRADDLGAGLERDLHYRIVAADQARRAHRLDAHIAMRVDGEYIDTGAAV